MIGRSLMLITSRSYRVNPKEAHLLVHHRERSYRLSNFTKGSAAFQKQDCKRLTSFFNIRMSTEYV